MRTNPFYPEVELNFISVFWPHLPNGLHAAYEVADRDEVRFFKGNTSNFCCSLVTKSHLTHSRPHGLSSVRLIYPISFQFLPIGASLVAQRVKRLPAMRETQVRSLGGKIPWRREWQPTPGLWPGESQRQKSLVGYSP